LHHLLCIAEQRLLDDPTVHHVWTVVAFILQQFVSEEQKVFICTIIISFVVQDLLLMFSMSSCLCRLNRLFGWKWTRLERHTNYSAS
jgi:hypothetical protein